VRKLCRGRIDRLGAGPRDNFFFIRLPRILTAAGSTSHQPGCAAKAARHRQRRARLRVVHHSSDNDSTFSPPRDYLAPAASVQSQFSRTPSLRRSGGTVIPTSSGIAEVGLRQSRFRPISTKNTFHHSSGVVAAEACRSRGRVKHVFPEAAFGLSDRRISAGGVPAAVTVLRRSRESSSGGLVISGGTQRRRGGLTKGRGGPHVI